MSEQDNTDDSTGEQDRPLVNRRKLLKSIGAAGVLGVGGVTQVSAEGTGSQAGNNLGTRIDDLQTDVRQLDGHARSATLQQATETPTIKQLVGSFQAKDYSLSLDDAIVTHSKYEGLSWTVTAIPFETASADTQATVVYSTHPDHAPAGFEVDYSMSRSSEKQVDNMLYTHYREHDGEIISKTEMVDLDEESAKFVQNSPTSDEVRGDDGSQITPNGFCAIGPPSGCLPGFIYRLNCLKALAYAWAEEIASCGACVASAGWITWACGACVVTLVKSDKAWCCPCKWPW